EAPSNGTRRRRSFDDIGDPECGDPLPSLQVCIGFTRRRNSLAKALEAVARIATVYHSNRNDWDPRDMSGIRWLKISEALARLGHEVDIATNESRWQTTSQPLVMSGRLRRVPLKGLRWRRYDVVKTLFHLGFETLREYGGEGHPFIISKLGSVVGPED